MIRYNKLKFLAKSTLIANTALKEVFLNGDHFLKYLHVSELLNPQVKCTLKTKYIRSKIDIKSEKLQLLARTKV